MRCVIVPYRVAEGPENMALDAALLERVAMAPEMAFLRTYGWRTPTLSLGYFQSLAEARSDSRWSGVPVVRRPTGGGAIWHHHELTYAIIVPATHRAARPVSLLYRTVHESIGCVLQAQGVEVRRRGDSDDKVAELRRPFLCFTDRDPEDLVTASSKLVGSAQRKSKGAVLQHGSILLRASDRTPELPGVSDLGGASTRSREWAEVVSGAVVAGLELEPLEGPIPAGVVDRARELERLVYRDPSWTARR